MQWIDKIEKYTEPEEVRENTIGKTYKHNNFNKEFTQYSWAKSPILAFSGGLSIMFSKQSFYNSELYLSLAQHIEINKTILGFPKSLEYTDSLY